MAGDWIKMRTDLYRDPKVCLIADALLSPSGELAAYVSQICRRDMSVTRNVMRNVTVGALVALWGVTRHRGKRDGDDLVLRNATLSVCDDIADLPGLGSALSRVGWARETDDGVVFPRFFEEFNTDPTSDSKAKNAERQKRYREKRNALRNVTVTSESDVREEREKRERNTPKVPKGTGQEFEQFWKAVHRREGRGVAERAFCKAVEKVAARGMTKPEAANWLTERMVAFASSPQAADDVKGKLHPATWLNQGRYDDDDAVWGLNGSEAKRSRVASADTLASWRPTGYTE